MSRRSPVRPSIGIPRRIEKHRWLRSDGTPNFGDRIYKSTEELEILAKKPVAKTSPVTPILEAMEEMAKGYRSLVVVRGDKVVGLLVTTHLVNYLGGGDYFKIIAERHGYNVYTALKKEPVEIVMEHNPVIAFIDERLPNVLEKMVMQGIGIIPVVYGDGNIYGVITEHDIVKYLYGKVKTGVKVEEIMTTPVITVNTGSSLREAMETMIKYGFRRLPVVGDSIVSGIITAKDIVRFFGSHEAFKHTVSGDIREILEKPVDMLMRKKLVTVSPDTDLSELVRKMFDEDVGSALVVNNKMELLGIVTERDVLYALATHR